MSSDTDPTTPALAVEELVAGYGGVIALDQVSISAGTAAITAVLGANGAGKTTLLRAVSGMVRPRRGRILLDGTDLVGRSPEQMVRAGIAHVPEGQGVIPELTVEENLRVGMMSWPRARSRADRSAALDEAYQRFRPLADRRRKLASTLSGGERQMLVIARALLARPRVLLLDEPMAALDKKLRGETQFELMDLQRRLELTFVIVTHDQSEAMTVADRIAVMDRGRLMQVAPPAEIYEQPNSCWVADFIGSINLFEGRVGDVAGAIEGTALGRLRVTGKLDAEPNATVWVAVRPEKIRLIPCAVEPAQRADTENSVLATVVDIGYLGDLSLYKLRTEAGVPLQAAIANIEPLSARGIGWNDKVWLSFAPEAAIVLTR